MDIEKSHNKKLSLEEIKEKYNLEEKFKTELEDMIFLKRIIRDGKYFENTSKGRMQAKIMRFFKKFLRLPTDK